MNNKLFKIDNFVLDTRKRSFFHDNRQIQMSSRAFDILSYLIEKKGEIVEKEELLKRVWADSFVEESNLPVHISAIRRVLQEKKGESKYIKTISGRGYTFIAPVDVVISNEEIAAIQQDISETNKIALPQNISLAVLPFTFEGGNKDNEYLADGITRSLINDLSQIADLKVLAYSAVREYKNPDFDLQEIGFLLDADKILTGFISEYKGKWEIIAELINVSDKRCIWGTSQVIDSDDLFKIKSEISVTIAEKLKLKLNVNEENADLAREEISAEAQKLYFRGKFILESRSTRTDLKDILFQALKFFREAVKKDPNYVHAYVGIGSVYVSIQNHSLLSKEEAYAGAQKALQLALRANDKLSEAYVLKGSIEFMFDRNFAAADQSFDKAIELNPNNPDAYHWKSLISICFERFEDSFWFESKAIELDPTSLRYSESLIRVFYFAGNYNKAITQAEEVLEFDEKSSGSCYFLSRSYAELGFFDDALKYTSKVLAIRSTPEMIFNQAHTQALAGDTRAAVEILENMQKNLNPNQNPDYASAAAVCVSLNDFDMAFKYLNAAFENGDTDICFLRPDPRFKNLRTDERFSELLVKMRLK